METQGLADLLIERSRGLKPDAARAAALGELATYLKNKKPRLNFICTHNSRRSHFAQILSELLAAHFGLDAVETYSGGTEATAFHPNAVRALEELGIRIAKMSAGVNPHYRVFTGNRESEVFSKVYSAAPNPARDFMAVMVCSSADAGCPLVTGADKRIALPFEDPKKSDGTADEARVYRERALEIGEQLAWAFLRARP